MRFYLLRLSTLLSALFLLPAPALAQPEAKETHLLFALGDTGDCRTDGTRQVVAALKQQPGIAGATLVELGDLAYPVATRERLAECHEPHLAGLTKNRYAVPGNHDWADPKAAGFFSFFPAVPRSEKLPGGWQLLLLDSNLDGAAWKAQLTWLEQSIATAAGQCLIAAWHHPRWSSGTHGDDKYMGPLWERVAGKVSIVLNGHDHHYESLPPLAADGSPSAQGSRSFVVGTGGTYLYKPMPARPGSTTVFSQWGFLRLELNGSEYSWQAINVAGKVIDSGTGRCLGR